MLFRSKERKGKQRKERKGKERGERRKGRSGKNIDQHATEKASTYLQGHHLDAAHSLQ